MFASHFLRFILILCFDSNYYAYHLELGEQAGTFWCVITITMQRLSNRRHRYHSHLSTQYIDGLRGPLIIYDM